MCRSCIVNGRIFADSNADRLGKVASKQKSEAASILVLPFWINQSCAGVPLQSKLGRHSVVRLATSDVIQGLRVRLTSGLGYY